MTQSENLIFGDKWSYTRPYLLNGNFAYVFLFLVLALIVVIFSIINEDYKRAALILFGVLVIGFFTMEFRGVEINFSAKKIRKFFLFPWGRHGKWATLNDFTSVELFYESYKVKTTSFMSESGRDAVSRMEAHGQFLIILYPEPHEFLVHEIAGYADAKEFGNALAKKLNLPFNDNFN